MKPSVHNELEAFTNSYIKQFLIKYYLKNLQHSHSILLEKERCTQVSMEGTCKRGEGERIFSRFDTQHEKSLRGSIKTMRS